MEKYSAFRDPSTGIQPFLTPVAPHSTSLALMALASPLLVLVSSIRTFIIFIIIVLYGLVVVPLKAVPGPITAWFSWIVTAILCRAILFVLGFLWIPVEVISRRRIRVSQTDSWSPGPGDIIVSNWSSFVEVLWLAFRFDPIFLIPVSTNVETSSVNTKSPGRNTGTGSAVLSNSPSRYPQRRGRIIGFDTATLWEIIRHTGRPPVIQRDSAHIVKTLEEIRVNSSRPVVVFPECTTSNGRGLLKFADVFDKGALPVQGYKVFVMAIRYEPPTDLQTTLTHVIPSRANPLSAVFRIARSILPSQVSIRLLSPHDSPSSASFITSDVVSGTANDHLAEACATLVAHIGKLKRTGQGWEDKVAFLEFYGRKPGAKAFAATNNTV